MVSLNPGAGFPLKLGRVVVSPWATTALLDAGEEARELLIRHASGDWGNVSAERAAANQWAAHFGGAVVSSYLLDNGVDLWIITQADRSGTVVVLSDELDEEDVSDL